MDYVLLAGMSVLVAGLSAVTLAQRAVVPCSACRKGRLQIARNFAHRCEVCRAEFRRKDGALVRVDAEAAP